jgi:hypothetical protein
VNTTSPRAGRSMSSTGGKQSTRSRDRRGFLYICGQWNPGSHSSGMAPTFVEGLPESECRRIVIRHAQHRVLGYARLKAIGRREDVLIQIAVEEVQPEEPRPYAAAHATLQSLSGRPARRSHSAGGSGQGGVRVGTNSEHGSMVDSSRRRGQLYCTYSACRWR